MAIRRKGRDRLHPDLPPTAAPSKTAAPSRTMAARALAIGEEVSCALLLLSVALTIDRSLDRGYSLPKLLALRLLAPVVLAFAAHRLWRGVRPELPFVPVAAIVALGLWWTVATVTAVHPLTSLHGMPGRYNGLWTQTTCLGLFVVAALAPDRAAARRRLAVLVGTLLPVAAYTIVQYFAPDPRWPAPRPPSTIGQPVLLSAMLALAVPFTLAGTLAGRSRARTLASALATAVIAAAIAASLSRGPLVGAIVASIIVLAVVARVKRARLVPIGIGLALVGAAGSTVLLNPQRREGIVVRLRAFTHPATDPSVAGRLVFYRAAMRMAADHPLTGVGLESFGLLYPRYRPVEPASVPVDNIPSMVHNGYLQWAVTAGVPGLLFYLTVLGTVASVVGHAYRRTNDPLRRLELAAFLAALCGYAIQDLSGWLDPALSVFFWTILGLSLPLSGKDAPSAVDAHSPGARLSLAHWGATLVVAAAFASSAGLIPRTLAEVRAARTLGAVQSASEAALRAILEELPSDAYHLERVGTELARRFGERPDRHAYLVAADLLERAARLNPFDPYIAIQRIHLETLAEGGPPALRPLLGAEASVLAATSTDPNNPTVHVAVARLRYQQRRLAEAGSEVERALRLRPSLGSALIVKGDIQHATGDARAAASIYAEAAAQLDNASSAWMDAQLKQIVNLLESGQVERAASVCEALVIQRPYASMAHLLLGVTYATRGDTTRARAAYERTLLLDPRNDEARKALAALNGPHSKR